MKRAAPADDRDLVGLMDEVLTGFCIPYPERRQLGSEDGFDGVVGRRDADGARGLVPQLAQRRFSTAGPRAQAVYWRCCCCRYCRTSLIVTRPVRPVSISSKCLAT